MVQYSSDLDAVFTAVADPTRRGILERLGRREASITELAEQFDMTLTGMKKHVQLLERRRAGAHAEGRPRSHLLARHSPPRPPKPRGSRSTSQMVEARLDSLGEFLERTKGDQP